MCNPHSTTSPKGSPSHERTTQSNSSSQDANEDNDNNNNVEDYENDDISVTGSPQQTHSTSGGDHDVDETLGRKDRSPSPVGAFTSLIPKNPHKDRKSLTSSESMSGFTAPLANSNQNMFNHALAAQLFLQTPLIPPPSQWLYTQLYNNYQDLPWFRNTFSSNQNFRTTTNLLDGATDSLGVNLVKRSVTLISHTSDDKDEQENRITPPVTSSKRSPSPDILTADDDEVEVDEIKVSTKKYETLRSRTPKHSDVWRPY